MQVMEANILPGERQSIPRSLDYEASTSVQAAGIYRAIMRFGLKRILVIFPCTAAVIFAVGAVAVHLIRPRTPPQIFSENESAFRQYVANIQAGKIKSNTDYPIPAFLSSYDNVKSIDREGNCIVITFFFGPADAVPQLWYSPGGFTPMPAPITGLKQKHQFFEWHQLKSDWGFSKWDD